MNKFSFIDIKKQGLLLYEYIRGSHLYGLATETSDTDYGGVFMAPLSQLLGIGHDYCDQINNDTNDVSWYELNKYMQLLIKSNPTMLESLYVPDKYVLYESEIMKELRSYRDMFLTKMCFHNFGGYAVSQIKKCRGLNKRIVNPVTKRDSPLDFAYTFYNQGSTKIKNWLEYRGLEQKYCGLVSIPNMHDVYGVYYDWGKHFTDYGITVDEIEDSIYHELPDSRLHKLGDFLINYTKSNSIREAYSKINIIPIGYKGIVGENDLSNELRLSSVSKGEVPICYISYNQAGYTKHCIDYKNYKDWEKHRNPVRYESNLNKNYDAKNVMHSFRLIAMCTEIANGDGFNVDRTEIDRDFLLNVKNHKYEYDEIIEKLEQKKSEMDTAISKSTLPDEVDIDFVNNLLLKIRKMQYENNGI